MLRVLTAMQQNLGSLVRSAYFLGAEGVLCCARNSAPLSPTVSKASAGALELLPLHSCSNLMRTLQTAADSGWLVLGALPSLHFMPIVPHASMPSCLQQSQLHSRCQ